MDGPQFLLPLRGQEQSQLGRFGRVRAILRDRQLPATQCRRAMTGITRRQRRDSEFPYDLAVGTLAQAIGIRPVAHKGGIPTLPHRARLFFLETGDTRRTDRTNPAGGYVQRGGGLIVIDRDLLVPADNGAAAVGINPFQCVASQTFIGLALPDETPKVLVAGRPFALLNFLGY